MIVIFTGLSSYNLSKKQWNITQRLINTILERSINITVVTALRQAENRWRVPVQEYTLDNDDVNEKNVPLLETEESGKVSGTF